MLVNQRDDFQRYLTARSSRTCQLASQRIAGRHVGGISRNSARVGSAQASSPRGAQQPQSDRRREGMFELSSRASRGACGSSDFDVTSPLARDGEPFAELFEGVVRFLAVAKSPLPSRSSQLFHVRLASCHATLTEESDRRRRARLSWSSRRTPCRVGGGEIEPQAILVGVGPGGS